jgi:hypothetical protein
MAFTTQSITSADTNTIIAFDSCDSIIFTNAHASDAATIDLWISGTASTDIVATGVLIDLVTGILGYATGHTSAMVVQGDNATAVELLNERLYKSDGTFIGKCTAVGGTTSITISGGTETMLADEDNLYVGNRYYLLNNVVIPNGASLKLEGDEINFNTNDYILLATTDAVNLDIITR